MQPMILRPRARELIAGIARDPTFGSVIVFAVGMTLVLVYLILGVGFQVFAIRDRWWELLLAGALGAGIALLIARWVARGMTQPLRDMAQAARRMETGDYTARVSTESRDEVGQLAVAFNRMSSELGDLELLRRELVANVSHELKTPLTSIAGYAETLIGQPGLDTEARRFAETILANARRMQRLVDDLLDLSKIESGGWQPETRSLAVEAAARDAWRPLTERAAGHGVQLEIATNATTINGDPEALRQIFTNLFDNALRHTRQGGRIRVATQRLGHDIVVRVSDTGSGIPAEHLPRIFERFYRVDPGRSREEGGTGLGLAIVKHLVEAHGGRVEAESELGRGTTILLYFPA